MIYLAIPLWISAIVGCYHAYLHRNNRQLERNAETMHYNIKQVSQQLDEWRLLALESRKELNEIKRLMDFADIEKSGKEHT